MKVLYAGTFKDYVDVGVIAKSKGGGHKQAAGFQVDELLF